jgi:hypothetical protein
MTIRVYGATWPAAPFRVDVSAYFNSRAGYTALEGHIVMYSTDPASQDLYALEMLLHEVQHAESISDPAIAPSVLAPAFDAAVSKQPEQSIARAHFCDCWGVCALCRHRGRPSRLHSVLNQAGIRESGCVEVSSARRTRTLASGRARPDIDKGRNCRACSCLPPQ